jgi:hypothetical protein
MCGMFELPDREIKFDCDVTQTELDKAKELLSKAGKVFFYHDWVKIPNVDRYNSYSGEKNEKARDKELALVPKELIDLGYSTDTSINTSIHTYQKSEIRNQKEKGVGKTLKYPTRESVTQEDFEHIAKVEKVSLDFVLKKWRAVCNWEDEKPGRMNGRNWKATLMNWIVRDKDSVSSSFKSPITAGLTMHESK